LERKEERKQFLGRFSLFKVEREHKGEDFKQELFFAMISAEISDEIRNSFADKLFDFEFVVSFQVKGQMRFEVLKRNKLQKSQT